MNYRRECRASGIARHLERRSGKGVCRTGKYPPLGKRGVSSTAPRAGFSLGSSPLETLCGLSESTRLMVQFESPEAYEQIDALLAVEGIEI